MPEDEILLEVDNLIQHGQVMEIVGRTEPGARVIVNDEPVFAVAPDGTFKHFTQPFANPGANQITITAQNAKGQIATRRKTVYIQQRTGDPDVLLPSGWGGSRSRVDDESPLAVQSLFLGLGD